MPVVSDVTLKDILDTLDAKGLLNVQVADLYRAKGAIVNTSGIEVDPGTIRVNDVVHDSRQIAPGNLFCALRGSRYDGHRFVGDIHPQNPCAALVEEVVSGTEVTQISVTNTRTAMAHAAAITHGHPSRDLAVVGITGTNGKTTTTHIISSILNTAGIKTAVIGTLSGRNTTPESSDLQRQLAEYKNSGVQVVAMEVSSHGLSLERALATEFNVTAFLNLSPDHLDFHRDLDDYFHAKAKLFDYQSRHRIVNGTSKWANKLIQRHNCQRVTADNIEVLETTLEGARIRWREYDFNLAIPGEMNIENFHVAAEICLLLGVSAEVVAAAVPKVEQIAGRMQRVRKSAPEAVAESQNASAPKRYEAENRTQDYAPTVFVDYSHTPEGITSALQTLRDLLPSDSSDSENIKCGAELIIVFGCGGDRDKSKRRLMARAAQTGADRVWLTSDNPRSEDPLEILKEVEAGFVVDKIEQIDTTGSDGNAKKTINIEVDRRRAITEAIESAQRGDIVLIAGKGHEKTQEIAGVQYPFDDCEVAREALSHWSDV